MLHIAPPPIKGLGEPPEPQIHAELFKLQQQEHHLALIDIEEFFDDHPEILFVQAYADNIGGRRAKTNFVFTLAEHANNTNFFERDSLRSAFEQIASRHGILYSSLPNAIYASAADFGETLLGRRGYLEWMAQREYAFLEASTPQPARDVFLQRRI